MTTHTISRRRILGAGTALTGLSLAGCATTDSGPSIGRVVVVGGGVQGAATAFHLSRRGARVLVLERSAPGAGATGRSSGFVRMHYDLALEAELAEDEVPDVAPVDVRPRGHLLQELLGLV